MEIQRDSNWGHKVVESYLLLKGFLIGFSIAATVGPIGVLCIQRTLERGRLYGFISGLGAATADATYGSIAAFGLTIITQFLVGQQFWIRLIGGLFLLYLGVRTFFSTPSDKAAQVQSRGFLNAYTSTLFLTLTNPLTILSFIAIFAGVGLVGTNRSYVAAALTVLGVFLGSTLWWLLLSIGIGLFRGLFKRERLLWLRWVNQGSGTIIFLFGVLALLSLLSLLH